MPLIVGHGLLGASIVAASNRPTKLSEDLRCWLLGALLGVLPDLDLFFPWILGLGVRWHGAFTHSLLFALVVGWAAARLAGRGGWRSTVVYSLAVFSHALLDAAVKKRYGGSALFWPLTNRVHRFGWIDYFAFYPGSNLEPLPELIGRAIVISLYELLIFGPVFLLALIIRRMRARQQSTQPQESSA